MKKALSLALALMLLMSFICTVPVLAAAADGSAEHPYYVANPMSAPSTITIPANSTVYYQYKASVFNGWEVGGYGLSAITVDGVVYDTPDKWGEIYAPLKFNFMSPGLVGYVNNTAEDVEMLINHNEPVGSESNPDQLVAGENVFTIPANNPSYVADYQAPANGEYTFECAQTEDFNISVEIDDTTYTLNGSLTLELEKYTAVRVYIAAVGNNPTAIIHLTAPKAGTATNPVWLSVEAMEQAYVLTGNEPMYFDVDGALTGSKLLVESKNGTALNIELGGVPYTAETGSLSLDLNTNEWTISMVVSQVFEADNELYFSVEYVEGSYDNPVQLGLGDNAVSVPAGVDGYYYSYVVEQDGLLIVTPSDKSVIGYLDMIDEELVDYAYLMAESSVNSMMMPVSAGEIIMLSLSGLDDEETMAKLPVDITLNLAWKDLLSLDTFEEGNLNGWSSTSNLTADDVDYIAGWYSAKFEVTKDWGNIYKYLTVEPNTAYEISFKLKGAQDGSLWVKFHKDDWTGDIGEVTVNNTTEWADYTVTLNSGDYTTVVMLFQYAGYAADGQTLWLDDLVITKSEGGDAPVIPEPPVADGLVNGDFETGDNTGWETHQSTTISGDAAHSGSYGANLKGDGGWGGLLNQTVPAKAGTSYEITFWLKVNNTGVNLQIKDGSAGGALLDGGWFDKNAAKDWTQKTFIVTPTTDGIFLNFCGSGAAPEDVYVDDMTVTELKAASNDGYIVNGDFETGKEDHWENVWGSCSTSFVPGRDSEFALNIISGTWKIVRQKVAVKPNTDYVVTLYGKDVNNMTLLVKDGNDSGNMAQAGIAGGADWTKTTLVFNSGANEYVYICLMGGEGTDQHGTFDDVHMFEKVEPSNDGYIVNGTFETGDSTPWDNLWGSCPTVEIVSGGKDSAYALYVVSGQWNHVRQTNIAVEANTNYKISVWVKNANNMNLLVKDGADTTDLANVPVNAGDEWTEFVVEFNSGNHTSIIFSLMGGEGADQYGTFDNIVMEKVESEPEEVLYGDSNGDGKLNNRDLALLQQFLNNIDISGRTFDEVAADVNADGKINNRDLAKLQQILNS